MLFSQNRKDNYHSEQPQDDRHKIGGWVVQKSRGAKQDGQDSNRNQARHLERSHRLQLSGFDSISGYKQAESKEDAKHHNKIS